MNDEMKSVRFCSVAKYAEPEQQVRELTAALAAEQRNVERLEAVVIADDEYLRLMQVSAIRHIGGNLITDSERQDQMDSWEKCCSTRKAAIAAAKGETK